MDGQRPDKCLMTGDMQMNYKIAKSPGLRAGPRGYDDQ